MIIDEEPFLSHYGKKGMKWGVRKESSDTTGSVRDSRKEIAKLGRTANEIIREGRRAPTKKARQQAAMRYKKEVLDKVKSEEFKKTYAKASTITKGEIAINILVAGPFAPLLLSQTKNIRKAGYDMELDTAHEILRELRTP